MVCVFGNWAPSFMGECSNGPQYSCPTPRPPRGGRLSSQGPFGSGDSVTGICDDGGYIIGVSSLICVMGHWAPSFFGDCTNSQRYSCRVPSPRPGMTLSRTGNVKSDESVTATCTENMKVLVGGYGVEKVKGYSGTPDSFGTIKLTGYKALQKDHGFPTLSNTVGIVVLNGVVYVNGVPVAQRTNRSGVDGIFVDDGQFISVSSGFTVLK
ncbi:hypothetical protein NECAME_01868 [Necator americanus]|uniref:Sushi domain-containing protein n=1 Tax=Necator americanus TaxID=51031 RepID=W2TN27_NECAM|nr:hypothetical protein NECAME_01868 [Necator americanus]ETN83069.1 hypothetical protein NECAME_01868 [Necator americanus]